MYINLSILIFCLLSTALIHGAEVDHYSARNKSMEDALDTLNERANTYLQRALLRSNLQSKGCNEESLYKELKIYFANHSKGQFSKDLLYDPTIPKTVIPLEESIYQNWTVWNGYLLGRDKAKDSPLALGPIVKLGPYIVGTDKFEHMFGMGNDYFERYYRKGKSLLSILKHGVFLEKTILGGNVLATGVFSYADLSANFNGMRSWNHMLQKEDDILGAKYNEGPYITCNNQEWIQNKEIDFSNYIDLSMDESINCSKFASKKGTRKFINSIKSLNKFCLEKNSSYAELQKYDVPIPGDKRERTISHFILNREGHKKVSYFNEF